MNNILVIGAGGVSSVTVHKMAGLPDTFNNITLASRTLKKCKKIQTEELSLTISLVTVMVL